MKPLKLILIATIAFVSQTFSQDTLFLNSGKIIAAKVVEIGTNVVKYKKPGRIEGPSYDIDKNDIASIHYSGGTQDLFSKESSAAQTPSMVLVHVSGQEDQSIPQNQSSDTRIFKGNNAPASQVLNAAVIIGAEALSINYLNKSANAPCHANPGSHHNQNSMVLPLIIGLAAIVSHIK